MKKFTTTSLALLATLILSLTSTPLRAQISDASTSDECITIKISETKDKILYAGVVAPNKDAWIDLNGDGVCQPLERIGRSTEPPSDYTDVFYMGPELEAFVLEENVHSLHLYGTIEALRVTNSETNTSPESVDLSQCTALKYFKAYECMDLEQIIHPTPENNVCEMLSIKYTPFQSLDLSNYDKLLVLEASFNKNLEQITLAECPEMDELDLSFTKISQVDLSKVPALTALYMCQAMLSNIDLSLVPNLDLLSLGANYFEKLDLSPVPNVTYLSLFDNNLTTIDLSKLTILEDLAIEQNKLKTIDLNANTKLKTLTLHLNELTDLDLSMLPNLHLIALHDNNFSEKDMEKIVEKIPHCKEYNEDEDEDDSLLWGHLYIVNLPSPRSNVCNTLQVAALKEKGWTPLDVNGGSSQDFMLDAVEYSGSNPSGICSPIEEDGINILYTATGVRIEGLAPRTSVSLYSTSGELLQRYNSLRSREVNIQSADYLAGSYIVTIGNKGYKITLR